MTASSKTTMAKAAFVPQPRHAAPRQRHVAVFQLGARRHYAVPLGLESAGALDRLVTDAYADWFPLRNIRALLQQLPHDGVRRLYERRSAELKSDRVHTLPLLFVQKALRRFRRRNGESQADAWVRQNREFGRASSRRISSRAACVYAFNGAALEVFVEARRRSMRCVLDQTSAPWRYNRDLLAAETARWPRWEDVPADLDVSGAMIQREEEEWARADRIICGSQFVVDAMDEVGGPVHKCRVVSYPTAEMDSGVCKQTGIPRDHVNVLFLGTAQLRKGIQYLWEAADRLCKERYRFRAVGPIHLTASATAALKERIELIGVVTRAQVCQQYAWADVLTLPTLSEGSANVCHEALACGCPVITTRESGLSRDCDGVRLVPSRNPEELAAAIADATPRGESRFDAEARSIAQYRQELGKVIAELEP